MSRLPITNESVQSICQSVSIILYAECLGVAPDLLNDDTDIQRGNSTVDIINLKEAQLQDKVAKHRYTILATKEKPSKRDSILKRQLSNLKIVDEVLYRQVKIGDEL